MSEKFKFSIGVEYFNQISETIGQILAHLVINKIYVKMIKITK